ncbi:MAG TPA: HAMP domain-containing sensor histidine kinase [Thermoanaerobaculia bacterium]|nr:HAMP domain-containing sensor histidine kinase [Thermoanaerobaculia bacterium]
MSLRTPLLTMLALALGSALVFYLFERQLSRAWFAFGVHPDVISSVERARDDQKRLAQLDPAQEASYRRRFDEVQRLLARLRVLEYSRQQIARRYEMALLGLVIGITVLSGSAYAWRQTRQERRLARLQAALGELAAGRTDVHVGERGSDLFGRIARMVEETSRRMARDRRRLASLENLSAWQEAARRHAHEMRTPLAAARLELARLRDLRLDAVDRAAAEEELARLRHSVEQELERLSVFTQRFTSFARLPQPAPARHDLARLAGEFAALFAAAWPELTLQLELPAGPVVAFVDPEMLRQVLVNLGDNSAHALREAGRQGTLALTPALFAEWAALDVADDGPGVAVALRAQLFAPYVTSRRIGEGMGLGLAIARKILLDHGGDLELVQTGSAGTTFRLLFPRAPAEEAA